MSLRNALQAEAARRALWPQAGAATSDFDLADAFYLVRDMPYGRASDWEPSTVIREWRGTCSGKHYLLKAVFAELGAPSQLIACTHRLTAEDADGVPPPLRPLLADGAFVDVHNYLVVDTAQGSMVVDATWPLSVRKLGLPVNEQFVTGKDMKVACVPIDEYVVPNDQDPQSFKEDLLRRHFTDAELAHREAVIQAISRWLLQAF
jgi:hypothetical protein